MRNTNKCNATFSELMLNEQTGSQFQKNRLFAYFSVKVRILLRKEKKELVSTYIHLQIPKYLNILNTLLIENICNKFQCTNIRHIYLVVVLVSIQHSYRYQNNVINKLYMPNTLCIPVSWT